MRKPLLATAAIAALALITTAAVTAQSSRLPGTIVLPPSSGVYLGAFAQGDDHAAAMHALETSIGRKLAIHVSFFGFDRVATIASDPVIRDDVANNRISLISWACGGSNLSRLAAGGDDARLDRAAAAFKALGSHPFMVRFMWEMNLNVDNRSANGNDCYSGGSLQQSASEFVSAQRHIEQRFAADGVRNVTWLWCPAGSPGAFRKIGPDGMRAFYPGAQYVDWICFDAYDFGGRGAIATLTPFAREFAGERKPVVIAETGELAARPNGRMRASQQEYLSALTSALQPGGELYPFVKAVCYFDSTPSNSHRPWTLEGPGMSAFASMAQNGYFNPPVVTGPRQ